MKIQVKQQNNNGSTLIMIIICIAFVSILCSVLLSVAVNNVQMKVVDKKTKTNFYEAESAFDEIKTGLEEVVADQLEIAYQAVMKTYIEKSDIERKQIFAKTFIDGMAQYLGGMTNATSYNTGILGAYIQNSPATLEISVDENILVKDMVNPELPTYLTLKNIKISYTDSDQYKTTISADITINIPGLNFTTVSVFEPTFADYSLIADEKISLDTAPNVLITGNLYAGKGGVSVHNQSSLNLNNATNIVTRGDVNVSERSKLDILGYPNVWAKNITTVKGSDTENPTSITIQGICYVADDLSLNATHSDVVIVGDFYGYSYGVNDDSVVPESEINTAKNSSAILINGSKSNLDLSRVNNLLIAGRAYLDPKSRGNESTSTQGTVRTGEALAIKGNQYAYLVPAVYMWSGSNPVALETYHNKPSGVVEVDYNRATDTIDLKQYADGFSKIYYKSGTQDLVYYYIKFKSEEKANQYMQEYYTVNNPEGIIGIVDNRIKSFASSIKVKNPITSLISAGNIFTYSSDTGKSSLIPNTVNPDTKPDGSKDSSLLALESIASTLVQRYNAVSMNLVDNTTAIPFDKNSVFNSIVHTDNIKTDNLFDTDFVNGIKTVVVDSNYVVYIVDNTGEEDVTFEIPTDSSLPNNGRQGIVIATGSVKVTSDYTGLILAGDTISITPSVKIHSSKSMVEAILQKNNSNVNRYFRDYATLSPTTSTTENTEAIHISDLIVYDNWIRNEE
jgi:type II secretory pathway pseudopilin PulG